MQKVKQLMNTHAKNALRAAVFFARVLVFYGSKRVKGLRTSSR